MESAELDVVICRFFFQAEDGIRDLVRSRGLGDVYKRQTYAVAAFRVIEARLDADDMARLQERAVAGGDTQVLSLIHI